MIPSPPQELGWSFSVDDCDDGYDYDDDDDDDDGGYDDDDDDDYISGLSAIETEPEFKLLLPLAAAIWWLSSQKYHHHHHRPHHHLMTKRKWKKEGHNILESNDKSALAFWESNLSINSHSPTFPVLSLLSSSLQVSLILIEESQFIIDALKSECRPKKQVALEIISHQAL